MPLLRLESTEQLLHNSMHLKQSRVDVGVLTERVIIRSWNWHDNTDAQQFEALVKPASIGTALELIETEEDQVNFFECQ